MAIQIIGTGAGDFLRATNGGPTEVFGDLSPTSTPAQIATAPFGNDTLIGGTGNDTLFGQKGADSLIGSGNDDLRGGAGQDTLIGTGNDTLFGNKDADQLFGGASAFGGQGNDTIFGSTTARGELGNDLIYGGTSLFGGNGNDTLVGSSASQTFTGNESSEDEFNSDQFVFSPATTLTIAGQTVTQGGFGGTDTIADFQSGPGLGDVIKLLNLDSNATVSVSQTGADVTIVVAGTTSPDQGSPVPVGTSGSVTNASNQSAAQTIIVRNVNIQQFLAVGSEDLIVNDNIILNTGNAIGVSVNGVTSFVFTTVDRLGRNIDASSVNGVTLTANATNFQLNGIPQFTSVNNDTVLGSSNNDTIDGLAGNDTITAGAGNDSVAGGPGNDTINGGTGFVNLPRIGAFVVNAELPAGSDSLFGNDGNDLIFGEGADSLSATNTATTFSSGNTDDYIDGGAGDDTLSGDVGADTLVGGAGNDSLSGGTGNDYLNGGAGNDVLTDVNEFPSSPTTTATFYTDSANPFGGGSLTTNLAITFPTDSPVPSGLNTLTGVVLSTFVAPNVVAVAPGIFPAGINLPPLPGTGTQVAAANIPFFFNRFFQDVLLGGDGNDVAFSGSGNDLIEGGTGNDVIDGGTDNDILFGGTGNDAITGGQGSDTISGGPDADILDGGSDNPNGFDYVYYGQSAGGVTVNLITGNALSFGGGDAPTPGDTINGFEGVIGSEFGDVITGNADNNILIGLGGNDSFFGGDGRDYIAGGDGDDTLNGQAGIDTLVGGAGNDVLINTPGDVLAGGSGDDIYVLSGNVLIGATTAVAPNITNIFGEDSISGSSDQIRLTDIPTAGFQNIVDLTNINTANIEIIDLNFTVAAIINGRDVPKVINVGSGAVTVLGGGAISINFVGGTGADSLTGGLGDDTINGAGGDDTINGGVGNDNLSGGTGNDSITGGAGADILTGGSSSDVFNYNFASESSGITTIDTIVDFITGAGGDIIDTPFIIPGAPAVQPLFGGGAVQNIAAATIDEVFNPALGIPALGLLANQAVLINASFIGASFIFVNNGTAGISQTDDLLIRLGNAPATSLVASNFQ